MFLTRLNKIAKWCQDSGAPFYGHKDFMPRFNPRVALLLLFAFPQNFHHSFTNVPCPLPKVHVWRRQNYRDGHLLQLVCIPIVLSQICLFRLSFQGPRSQISLLWSVMFSHWYLSWNTNPSHKSQLSRAINDVDPRRRQRAPSKVARNWNSKTDNHV